jgi:hypothetical protein
MTEQVEKDIEIYGYRNGEGQMFWTPNIDFAKLRADYYETYEVYVEKN